jgi:hypothetical protein
MGMKPPEKIAVTQECATKLYYFILGWTGLRVPERSEGVVKVGRRVIL